MTNSSLTSNPPFVVVDDAVGPTATTNINYVAGSFVGNELALWERFDYVSWGAINVDAAAGPVDPRITSPDPLVGGTIGTPLAAGHVYEVRMYHDSTNPNTDNETPADAAITVMALAKTGMTNLIGDENHTVGGTYYSQRIATTRATTFLMQVSNLTPTPDGNGIPVFPAVDPSGPDTLPTHRDKSRIDHFGMLVEPLLAGHQFTAVILVADAHGGWEVRSIAFQTLRRVVHIGFFLLDIINDGALGGTKASFFVWVREGNTTVYTRGFGFDADGGPGYTISDRPSPGHWTEEHIPLGQFCPVCELGPTVVTPENRRCRHLDPRIDQTQRGHQRVRGKLLPGQCFPRRRPARRENARPLQGVLPNGTDGEHHPAPRRRAGLQITGDEFQYQVQTYFSIFYVV